MNNVITISIPEVLTINGQPVPDVSTNDAGNLVLEFSYDSSDAAVKGAKALVRELVKFRLDGDVAGRRDGSTIIFTFGGGGEIPATWKGRAASVVGEKPALLIEIQTALAPYAKASYFNSSVNEGLTVASVPVGLQFEHADGEITAKLLLNKKGEWSEVAIATTDEAVELVRRLQALTVGLSS